ncbi:MAG: NUDIX domain-containing protein [Candidatus Saccharimonadales bacterium]
MEESKEILDLVDDNDTIIGTETRENVYKRDLHNFRMVYGLIQNADGLLWVPRRSPGKTINPLYLDSGVGGHVSSGESYEEAFARESNEELRVTVEEENISFLGKLDPKLDGSYAHAKVWLIYRNKVPSFNPDDFCEAFWMWPREVIDRHTGGENVKSDFLVILNKLFNI